MNASLLHNISISAHPTKGLGRRADLISFTWNATDKFIKQKYAAYEIDLAGNRDLFSRYEVELFASDRWLVNPTTGALLMTQDEFDELPTEDRPTAYVGEYTFFLMYAETPIELYPLLLSKTMGADVKKKFDR